MNVTGERFVPGATSVENEAEHMQRYHSVLKLIEDKVVLDAACGEGYGSFLMAERAKHVFGIDVSDEVISWAQEQYDSRNLEFHTASVDALPFADNSFDVVVSFETIEHVNESMQNSFLREIKRVLKPDGILVMSTPDKLTYSDIPKYKNEFHVREFYFREFQLFLEKYFSFVTIYEQGHGRFGILRPSPNQEVYEAEFNLVGQPVPFDENRQYIIGVCSEQQINELSSMQTLYPMSHDSPKFHSRLYIDFGDGYREDVVEYSPVLFKGNEFSVEFHNLDQLGADICGLRWQATDYLMCNLRVGDIKTNGPSMTLEPIDKWKTVDGVDVFDSYRPMYEIRTDFRALTKFRVCGEIERVTSNVILSQMSQRLDEKGEESRKLRQLYEKERVMLLSDKEHLLSDVQNLVRDKKQLEGAVERITGDKSLLEDMVQLLVREKENLDQNHRIIALDKEMMRNEIERLTRVENTLEGLVVQAESQLREALGSTSWKLTAPLRWAGRLFRLMVFRSPRKILKSVLRRGYHALPGNERFKASIKGLVYTVLGPAISKTAMYKAWRLSTYAAPVMLNEWTVSFDNALVNIQPGRIAVHLHLYYIDLLDEFLGYLKNMPFKYDLYISIPYPNEKAIVETRASELTNVTQISIQHVPNRGRDVAPMLVAFAQDLLQYDYICHIHTKKSLYTGREQDGWREHLLYNLLGSADIIRKVFTMFDQNPALGLLYPETYVHLPYAAHTWLSNKVVGQQLLGRFGLSLETRGYLDFPAGTMFWARKIAVAPLLGLHLSYDDFPLEGSQNDGTIAHAVERSVATLVTSQGMTYAEVNFRSGQFNVGKGGRNLWQYWARTKDELIHHVNQVELISFDIFDTLVARPVIDPEFVFLLVELEARHSLGIDVPFNQYRKKAEEAIRQDSGFAGDCTIDDVYESFGRISGLSKALCRELKDIERRIELKLCAPRNDMVDVFNHSRQAGKKIVLISDMYLTADIIEEILNNCGVVGYNELLLSSELGIRKDTGEMWRHFIEKFGVNSTLHIGDNEHSDVQIPGDMQLPVFHVMSGANMFYNTSGSYLLRYHREKITLGDAILLGTMVYNEFNSPFALAPTRGVHCLADLPQLGRVIYGPIILRFIIWLINQVRTHSTDKVLFLSREGYLLQQIYDRCVSRLGLTDELGSSGYFLASRRATSIASIQDEHDIYAILERAYNGTLSGLLSNRFGLELTTSTFDLNMEISLPNDVDYVKNVLTHHKDQIMENVALEQEAYLRYCNELGNHSKIAVVDLGYSGSIQYYLSKLLKKPIDGYYFVVNTTQVGKRFAGNTMQACFGTSEDDGTKTSNQMYKYALLLEAVLTAPEGQLNGFRVLDGEVKPHFALSGQAQAVFTDIQKIHLGITEYVDQVIDIFGSAILDVQFSEFGLEGWFGQAVLSDGLVGRHLRQYLLVEDNYCSDSELSVFDVYRSND